MGLMGQGPGPTKRQRREAARAERIAAQERERADAGRRRRLGAFGAVLLAAVVIVVAAVVLSSNSEKRTLGSGGPLTGAAEVEREFAGIAQSGITLGDPGAKALIIQFVHPKCPVCRDFELNEFPGVLQDLVRSGRARIETHVLDFDLLPGTGDSVRGTQAMHGAAAQDRLYQALGIVYRNQGEEGSAWMTDRVIRRLLGAVPGLDIDRALADGAGAAGRELLDASNRSAREHGISGTPAVLVGPDAGHLRTVAPTEAAIIEAVDAIGR